MNRTALNKIARDKIAEIIQEVRFGFKEQMLARGIFGVKPGRMWTDLFWEKELEPKIRFRLEAFFDKLDNPE